jgi:uncharacterized protein YbaP (TraB family)
VNGLPGIEGRKKRGAIVRNPALLLAIGLAALCLASPLFPREGANPGEKSFLWMVRGEKGTVYLLGSIHLLKRDMFPLDRKIEEAFEQSDVLAVETNVRDGSAIERQRRLLQGALYPGDDTIENHISKETFELLRRRFPDLPPDRMNRFKPWALAMTIAVLEYRKMGLDYDYGVDVYFLDKAGNGKQIRELERPDTVIAMLDGFSDEYQDLFLRYTLLDLETAGEQTDRIIRAWAGGDAATMEEILLENVHGHPGLMPVFDALFFQRNGKMAAKIEEYLKEGGEFFVVVGAGHLVGEKGIVELLRKKGFSVEQQ